MQILTPTRQSTTPEPKNKEGIPPGFATAIRIGLAVATAAAAAVTGHAVTQYLGDAWPFWIAIAAGALFVYFAALTAITIDGIKWHIPFGVIWGASFALALPWRAGTEALAITGIIAVTSVIAYFTYSVAANSYATLHTFTVSRQYASVLTSGIVVSLVVLYGAAVSRGSALLPSGVLGQIADQATRFVPTLLPSLVPEAGTTTLSVHDLALASVKSQLQDDPRYAALSPSDQEKVLKAAADQAAASFSKQVGLASSSPSTSIGSVAQGAVNGFLNRFHDKYGWYFTIAWLLGAFFIARSAAFLVTLVIAGFAWSTLTIGIALGLVQIRTEPSFRERITL